jgi:inorganic pyrophosphatase
MEAVVIEVLIEIPKGSRNKYEFDHERNIITLDRRLFSATTYPADYGFIPQTAAEDGDPLDALVLLDEPSFPGCLVHARPVGVFWMKDEEGPDAKVIAVPHFDPLYDGVNELEQLPGSLLSEIEHFFDVYKMLEPEKKSITIGYEGRDKVLQEIEECRQRYRERPR